MLPVSVAADAPQDTIQLLQQVIKHHREAEQEKATLHARLSELQAKAGKMKHDLLCMKMQLQFKATSIEKLQGGESVTEELAQLQSLCQTIAKERKALSSGRDMADRVNRYEEVVKELEQLKNMYPVREDANKIQELKQDIINLETYISTNLEKETAISPQGCCCFVDAGFTIERS